MGKLRKEIANSPAFLALRQGGDNLSRKARIVSSAIADREIRTVVDDPTPMVLFRFDGERWQRWSVVGGGFEPVDAPAPPLLAHLHESGAVPASGDRFRLEDGAWRQLDAVEPDPA